jgi:hypothetical protein
VNTLSRKESKKAIKRKKKENYSGNEKSFQGGKRILGPVL